MYKNIYIAVYMEYVTIDRFVMSKVSYFMHSFKSLK